MGISVLQWRVVTGIFDCRKLKTIKDLANNSTKSLFTMFEVLFLLWHYFEKVCISLLTLLYIFILLKSRGDIELNPGPRKLKTNSLSVCHWNLNSLCTHNFSKLTQLKAYNSLYKYDFICLSETYLDSTTPDELIENIS